MNRARGFYGMAASDMLERHKTEQKEEEEE